MPAAPSAGRTPLEEATLRHENAQCKRARKAVPAAPVLGTPSCIREKLALHQVCCMEP